MRAWYRSVDGRTADLCLFINSKNTRLTIRDAGGHEVSRVIYKTWEEALEALAEAGEWTNDLTGNKIGA